MSWTFSGADQPTSSVQNPTGITYSAPGTYDVTLTTGDGSTTISETKTAYVEVLSETAIFLPYFESFENVNALPNNDLFVDNPGGTGWELTTNAGLNSSKSIMVQNTAADEGNFDSFISNTFNLTWMQFVSIGFDVACAQRDALDKDALKIFVTKDCGNTWSMRRNLTSNNLFTASPTNGNFIPSGPTEWEHIDVNNINSSYYVAGFRFRFEFESDGGNNIYVDNINVSGILGTLDLDGEALQVNVYPNPVGDDVATISFSLTEAHKINMSLTDVTGRLVKPIYSGDAIGQQIFEVSTNDLAKGMYLVRIQVGESQLVKRIVVE